MTKTEHLEQICESLGIDVSQLPDRLLTTYLNAINTRLGIMGNNGTLEEYLSDFAGQYEKGFAEGKKTEYDLFWDNYQAGTEYASAFFANRWTDAIYKPKHNIVATNAPNLFANSLITDTLVAIDVTNATGIQNMFSYASMMKTIRKLIVSEKTAEFNNTFGNCRSLENITFEGTIAKNGINLQWSTNLTHDSIMSLINCLADKSSDTSGTVYKVTLGAQNIAKLTDAEQQIAQRKGWNLE